MSYPINYPTPQSANFQAFYGGGTTRDWVKPQGASMVRMLLIGAGGGGSTAGGGSGAVTQWIGPAMFIPDVLRISVGAGSVGSGGGSATAGGNTGVIYQAKDGTGYTLLTAGGGSGANAGTGGAGASAASNNFFGAAGIFKSVAGQSGANLNGSITASTTTFLCGGAGGGSTTGAGGSVASKFGYPALTGNGPFSTTGTPARAPSGYFITQPVMVGFGGAGGGGNDSGPAADGGHGGIGCGGGGAGSGASGTGGRGGDGAVFIWSW